MLALPLYAARATLRLSSEEKAVIADSLEKTLERPGTSQADSIRILYNIFDLDGVRKLPANARRIYSVAERSGDISTRLDILRHLANYYYANDSVLAILDSVAQAGPHSLEGNETRLFVALQRILKRAESSTPTERMDRLQECIAEYASPETKDIVAEFKNLFELCAYLKYVTHGELYETYLGKLLDKLGELPKRTGAVRNLVLTHTAILFGRNQNYQKSISSDRALLSVIDSLEAAYVSKGRKYRTLDANRYNCYRRILSNYPALSAMDVEYVHSRIDTICARNYRARMDRLNNERADIYYYMASKRYDDAIKAIKRQLPNPRSADFRPRYLAALVEASRAVGDTATLKDASVEYCRILEDIVKEEADDRMQEMQIIYTLNSLNSLNVKKEIERHTEKLASNRNALYLSLAVIVVMLGLLILLFLLMRRSRKLAKNVASSNADLKAERDSLQKVREELIVARDRAKLADKQKTDFVNNISHEIRTPLAAISEYSRLIADCVPGEKHSYLDKFVNIIELNTNLLMTLVGDILDVASLENTETRVDAVPTSVYEIADFAVSSIKFAEKPGVEVRFNPEGKPDVGIVTDRGRVVQVLTNLLSNGIKFTDAGSVTLDFEHDKKARTVTFSVTDTGIGIPDGCEEEIFNRFVQIDQSAQGCGLGLYICRLIAKVLGGSVAADPSVRRGARFVFTIPDNPAPGRPSVKIPV